MSIKITGTGSVIPSKVEQNTSFSNHQFFDVNGTSIKNSNEVIIEKFKSITGIEQRRYIEDNQTVTDIAIEAANKSIDNAKKDSPISETKNKENNLEPKKQTEDNKDSSLKSIN